MKEDVLVCRLAGLQGWQGNRAALCAGSDRAVSEHSCGYLLMLQTRHNKISPPFVLLVNELRQCPHKNAK